MRTALSLSALILSSCGYEPLLRTGHDGLLASTIAGDINAIGPMEPATTVLLVMEGDNLGPPYGTGGPVDLGVVDNQEYSGNPGYSLNAPFAVTGLPQGAYAIDAIMDVDGDFAFETSLGGATCGDWIGSHYAQDSNRPGIIWAEHGQVTDGVSIVIDRLLEDERPAFEFNGGFALGDWERATNSFDVQSYILKATSVHTRYDTGKKSPNPKDYPNGYLLDLDGPCPADADDPRFCDVEATACDTAFSVYYVDADGDGLVDEHPDYPGAGLKDVWPRAYIQYLGEAEYDGEGKVVVDEESGYPVYTPYEDPDGASWAGENFTFGVEAAFSTYVAPIGVPTKMAEISLMFAPAVLKSYPVWNDACGDEPPEDPSEGCSVFYDLREETVTPDDVPKGLWSLTLVSWTGQTWSVPNEISGYGLASTDAGFVVATQGGYILTR